MARVRDASVVWDLVVVGGGATGLGTAVDAASRGYRTLLAEAEDFGKGTSSRSTKLIHGGVRYLRQGNLALVRSALAERAILLRNAPHVVGEIPFVVPAYRRRDAAWTAFGLRLYDALAGRHTRGRSRRISAEETLALLPGVRPEGLVGGVTYRDARFDDGRLLVHLARTAAREGATVANRLAAVGVAGRGARATLALEDRETGERLEVAARAIVNAAGPFADDVRRLADASAPPILRPSRGAHVVLDRAVLPGEAALLIPDAGGGRVVFLVPWRGRVLLGTTDVPVGRPEPEPRASRREVEDLLALAGRALARAPSAMEIRSVFAGLRPLVRGVGATATLPRDHVVRVERSGLVTVTGGKWTTYRRMACDAVERAAAAAGLPARPCRTADLPLDDATGPGSGATIGTTDIRAGDVVWAARQEMARGVEDVLARRTAALFLDARAAAGAAPEVARLLAAELGRDGEWERREVEAFARLAGGYLPEGLA
jgi:glycerol-3-phosphate dehydrogenase